MSGVLALLCGVVGGSSGLAVTANSVTRTQSGFSASGTVTTTQSANANATGGTPPYTWAWARVSGSSDIAVSSATSQDPSWSAAVLDGAPEIAVWRITVTDDNSNTATADITITLRWNNLA